VEVTLKGVEQFELKWFLVAVLDLLGQKDKLRGLRIPETQEEHGQMIDILKETWGAVDALREFVLELVREGSARSDPPKTMPPEQAETWRRLRSFDIRYFVVSDSVFIWVPLDGSGQAGAVYHTLVALAGTELAFLSLGYPLRGGVAVGLASDSVPPTIYGPALNEAVRLESRVAKHPRVVCGRSIENYLQHLSQRQGDSLDARFESLMATACRGLVVTDSDGELILDYLGSEARGVLNDAEGSGVLDMGRKVHEFFQSQIAEWNKKGCKKLVERYTAASRYVDSRLGPDRVRP